MEIIIAIQLRLLEYAEIVDDEARKINPLYFLLIMHASPNLLPQTTLTLCCDKIKSHRLHNNNNRATFLLANIIIFIFVTLHMNSYITPNNELEKKIENRSGVAEWSLEDEETSTRFEAS